MKPVLVYCDLDPHREAIMADSGNDHRAQIERKPRQDYRAAADRSGDWYVWRRLGSADWATLRRCDGKEQAEYVATELNTALALG